jgi:hypothetical protein
VSETSDYDAAIRLIRRATDKLKGMKLEIDKVEGRSEREQGYRQGWSDACNSILRELEGLSR